MLRYLKSEEVLFIHHSIIEESGGSHGLRDLHLFESILERPKQSFGGTEMFPDVYHKAAAYFEGFARYHVFVDGNKRIGFACAARFLAVNKQYLGASREEVVKFAVAVGIGKIKHHEIAEWLKRHSKKL